MATTSWSRRYRLSLVVCGLFMLLVVHVSVRYVESTLFGFVTYGGLAPLVPIVVLGIHMFSFVALAGIAAVRGEIAGIVLGIGLLLLAVEPISSLYLWGDGCEVGRAAASLLPEITTAYGGAVRLHSWSGACTATLNTVLIGIAALWTGVGLGMGRIPDVALTRWMDLIETYWLSRSSG